MKASISNLTRAARLMAAFAVLPLLISAAFGQETASTGDPNKPHFNAQPNAQNDMRYFITRSGGKLIEGEKEYRFISFNIPNLGLIEDNMPFESVNEWRFPNEFEINDALSSVKQMGGRVARMYVLSICRKDGRTPYPCYVTRPGQFNEEAFRTLDKILEVANRVGIRVVIPFVDNWKWWGGIAEYASYRDKPPEAFWTDPALIEDFKKTVSFVMNRRNTYTGTLYKDDKAILAWETGNELDCPYSWTRQIAAYIKSQDPNHLVWDGFYIGGHGIHAEALTDPNIDIVSSHHYPGPGSMVEDIVKFHNQIEGKKAYAIGEFGFVPLAAAGKILDTVIAEGLSGAMVWSLRFHNRDGGFYWHSEGAGGDLYKAYHWPGFAAGHAYEESALLQLVRAKAFEIRGLAEPLVEPPSAPVLLPIETAAEISWRGSVGASAYNVERATQPDGPWTLAGMNIEDTWVQYRPLFSDAYAEPGRSYYYRVRAKNSAGASAPSNVAGPVWVESNAIVDELNDYSRMFAHGGELRLETKNARPYKEDIHRLRGGMGGWIMYRVLHSLTSASAFAFMDGAEKDVEFYFSKDGSSFVRIVPTVSRFPATVNPYGYKLPVRYDLTGVPPGNLFLKIVLSPETELSRVELRYGRKIQK